MLCVPILPVHLLLVSVYSCIIFIWDMKQTDVGGCNFEVITFDYFSIFRWFKFTLKPPYSIAHDKLRLAI